MEAALSTALALSPNQVFNAVNPGDKKFSLKYCKDQSVGMTMTATGILGKDGGLVERPTIETTTPGRESEFVVSCSLSNVFGVVLLEMTTGEPVYEKCLRRVTSVSCMLLTGI